MMNNNDRGFTLIELVVVILVIAVVAITALPNLDATDRYSVTTDRDQLISLLRSVQTRAMQNTKNGDCYGVGFTTNNIGMLTQDSNGSCTSVYYASSSATNGFLNLKPENSYTTTAVFVQFDDMGRPQNNVGNTIGRVKVTFAGAESVCIESEGYIHVCD